MVCKEVCLCKQKTQKNLSLKKKHTGSDAISRTSMLIKAQRNI